MSVYKQDLPPAGGYEALRYQRNVPFKGPSSAVLFGGVFAVCAYGWYRWIQGSIERRELAREHTWSRIYLVPVLNAELDRDAYRRQQARLTREKEIMKDIPDWEPGQKIYSTKRYIPPAVSLS